MLSITKHRLNYVLMLLLLFSNSGLAMDSVDYGHSADMGHASMAGKAAMLDHSPSAHAHHQMGSSLSETDESSDAADCFCDELCCVSSVNLFESLNNSIVLADSQSRGLVKFYQSVSHEILLPPPNS